MTRHRGRRRVVTAVLLAALAGAGVWFAMEWRDRGPDEASVDDAIDRFRASSTSTPTGELGDRPIPGVYEYEGSGREHLSFMSTDQAQGPVLAATVTLDGEHCWDLALEYNSFHRQQWHWCLDDTGVVETGGRVEQAFDFGALVVDERSTSVCDPPFVLVRRTVKAGDSWPKRCETTSETTETRNVSTGTVEFIGTETLTIGAAEQSTVHYRIIATLSGEQSGDDRFDLWFTTDRYLLVRGEREMRVVSPAPAPLNEVTYTESGTWTLRSLQPQR